MLTLKKNKSILVWLALTGAMIVGLLFISARRSAGNLESHDYVLNAKLKTIIPNSNAMAGNFTVESGSTELALNSHVKVDFLPEQASFSAHFQFIEPQVTSLASTESGSMDKIIRDHLVKGFNAKYSKEGELVSLYLDPTLPSVLIDLSWDLAFGLSMKKPQIGNEDLISNFQAPRRKGKVLYKWESEGKSVMTRTVQTLEDILQSPNPSAPKSTWDILSSEARCRFHENDLFPAECRSDEKVELRLGNQLILRGESSISFVKSNTKSPSNVAAKSLSADTASQPILDLSPEVQKQRFRNNLARNNTKGISFDNEIKVILDQDLTKENWPNEKRMAWAERLADYLLLHPEKTSEVGALAGELGREHEFFSLVPYILSVCGHDEAQAELVKMAQTFEIHPGAMFQIVSSMLFLDKANSAALTYLKDLEKRNLKQTSDIALLAIGKYSRQEGEVGSQALDYVTQQLKGSHTDEENILAIAALGNGGRDENMTILQVYLNSPSADLRKKAVDALRFVTDPAHFDILLTFMAGDINSSVRAAAAAALQYQPLPTSQLPILFEAIKQESSSLVRLEQLKVYAKNCRHDSCRERLDDLLQIELNGDLKAFLAREMARRERGQ